MLVGRLAPLVPVGWPVGPGLFASWSLWQGRLVPRLVPLGWLVGPGCLGCGPPARGPPARKVLQTRGGCSEAAEIKDKGGVADVVQRGAVKPTKSMLGRNDVAAS